jgi:hypothetical protein
MILSAAQITTFKRDGAVVCPGLVPTELTDRWREQIWWARFGCCD